VRICNAYPEKQKPHYISLFSYPLPGQNTKALAFGIAGICMKQQNRSNRIFLCRNYKHFSTFMAYSPNHWAYAAISKLKN